MENLVRLGLKCNQNCVFCNVKYNFKTKTTIEAKKEILSLAKKYPKIHISFTGGEPTLRNDLLELISFAKKRTTSRVEIQTNAMRCSYEHYVMGLKKAGLNGAFVALHSHRESISDELTRTPGSFKLTIKGLENLLNENIAVTINTVINSMNYKNLPDFVKFVNKKFPQIENINFSFVQPYGNAWSNKWIVPRLSDAAQDIRDAMQYCKDHNIEFYNPYCGIPMCYAKGFEKNCIENLDFNERDGENIHEGIQRVMENKVKAPQCKYCSVNASCLGVWIGYSKIYGFDELKPY